MSDFSKIKENYVFSRAYHKGKSRVGNGLVTYVLTTRSGGVRMGITASKKIGNAVTRSRARRVITAAFRSVAPKIDGNFDIVFVSRSRTPAMKSTELAEIMANHLQSLGCIQSV